MKIVIDIPKEEYELVQHGNKSYTTELVLMNAVAEGTPLPKGHGRIIDESKINTIYCETEMELYGSKIRYIKKTDAPTIVEADKEE